QEHGLVLMKDDGALRETAARIIAANPASAADYRAGKEKALQFLIGQCMRELRGRADAKTISDTLRELLV
ncbi:MAG TPA: GatB/YqeY domain-containing protein, partial [Clostridia bacterium]